MRRKIFNEEKLPHMGQIVAAILKERHMKRVQLARVMHCSQTKITALLHEKNWEVSELIEVGHHLQLDLFRYYRDTSQEVPLAQHQQLQQQYTELSTRANTLQQQLAESEHARQQLLLENEKLKAQVMVYEKITGK